ncbi:hypothetical protein GCM10009837_16250 [Streptomyces durmitorensis]
MAYGGMLMCGLRGVRQEGEQTYGVLAPDSGASVKGTETPYESVACNAAT